ncbi:MAG: cell division protein ZapA [Clostridia bacterium]|nr:cell division protein ZapA [Clostridia bacterium]
MDERNTVTVLIYGQEYTLSGDMPRDYILKIADHLDAKMKEVGDGTTEPYSKVAVLAGMLVADELYTKSNAFDELFARNVQLDQNAKNYEKLWEEVKTNFAQYKEEMASLSILKDNLQNYAKEKEEQVKALSAELAQEKQFNDELRSRIEALLAKQQQIENIPAESQKHIEELENRCRDIESSFFDIQMENIHLKNEIETLRGRR